MVYDETSKLFTSEDVPEEEETEETEMPTEGGESGEEENMAEEEEI